MEDRTGDQQGQTDPFGESGPVYAPNGLGPVLTRIAGACREEGLPDLTGVVVTSTTGLPSDGVWDDDRHAVFGYRRDGLPAMQAQVRSHDWTADLARVEARIGAGDRPWMGTCTGRRGPRGPRSVGSQISPRLIMPAMASAWRMASATIVSVGFSAARS